jgi:hypothetical protein
MTFDGRGGMGFDAGAIPRRAVTQVREPPLRCNTPRSAGESKRLSGLRGPVAVFVASRALSKSFGGNARSSSLSRLFHRNFDAVDVESGRSRSCRCRLCQYATIFSRSTTSPPPAEAACLGFRTFLLGPEGGSGGMGSPPPGDSYGGVGEIGLLCRGSRVRQSCFTHWPEYAWSCYHRISGLLRKQTSDFK